MREYNVHRVDIYQIKKLKTAPLKWEKIPVILN